MKSLNFSLEELKEAWNELNSISAENGDLKIVDYDGSSLTIEELYEKYFETEDSADISLSENQASLGERYGEKGGFQEKRENARIFYWKKIKHTYVPRLRPQQVRFDTGDPS